MCRTQIVPVLPPLTSYYYDWAQGLGAVDSNSACWGQKDMELLEKMKIKNITSQKEVRFLQLDCVFQNSCNLIPSSIHSSLPKKEPRGTKMTGPQVWLFLSTAGIAHCAKFVATNLSLLWYLHQSYWLCSLQQDINKFNQELENLQNAKIFGLIYTVLLD